MAHTAYTQSKHTPACQLSVHFSHCSHCVCVCIAERQLHLLDCGMVHSFYSFHSLHSFSLSFRFRLHLSLSLSLSLSPQFLVFLCANVSAFNFQLACTKVCNMFFFYPHLAHTRHIPLTDCTYACMTSSCPTLSLSLSLAHTHCVADNGLHKF